MEYIPGIIILLLFFILGIWGWLSEKRDWNRGISPFTNEPWELFDRDSQGGRGYKDNEGNYIWISWPVDK